MDAVRFRHIGVVIPALNEEGSIGTVVRDIAAACGAAATRVTVIVGDNGSTDATADVARAAGALVAAAPRRGYGSACLAALAMLPADVDVVVFTDGDGADDPNDAAALLLPLWHGEADLVIGSRALGHTLGLVEDGALTAPQRFGNALATTLLRVGYGVHTSDLGPYRAIRRASLDVLRMDDRDFGWTVQMQARAARAGLRSVDVPVRYRRRRTGVSKVAGSLRGSAQAGVIILSTLAREALPPGRGPMR